MAIRWFLSPVILKITNVGEQVSRRDGSLRVDLQGNPILASRLHRERYAKLAALIDPSTGGPYSYSAAISGGQRGENNSHCLCFVRSDDFTPIDADSDFVEVLDEAYEDTDVVLDKTPRQRRWRMSRVAQIKTETSARNSRGGDLDIDRPVVEWLDALGREYSPGFDSRKAWTKK